MTLGGIEQALRRWRGENGIQLLDQQHGRHLGDWSPTLSDTRWNTRRTTGARPAARGILDRDRRASLEFWRADKPALPPPTRTPPLCGNTWIWLPWRLFGRHLALPGMRR